MVWLSVRIQLMNQNASPTLSGNVLAALPIRATRPALREQPRQFNQPRNPPLAVARQP
jgi:hypothetical protein